MSFRDAYPIFHTADLERAVGFYRDRLGFDERYRFSDAFALVEVGHFAPGLTAVTELEPAGRASLWCYCEDVDAQVHALREA